MDYINEDAAKVIKQCLDDRKVYKATKLMPKKNVITGLVERKTIALFNTNKLKVGMPYKITFLEGTSLVYGDKSYSFNANESRNGIFLRGTENFISFVMIGSSDYPIIAALKPDMLFYIQEYKIDEQ